MLHSLSRVIPSPGDSHQGGAVFLERYSLELRVATADFRWAYPNHVTFSRIYGDKNFRHDVAKISRASHCSCGRRSASRSSGIASFWTPAKPENVRKMVCRRNVAAAIGVVIGVADRARPHAFHGRTDLRVKRGPAVFVFVAVCSAPSMLASTSARVLHASDPMVFLRYEYGESLVASARKRGHALGNRILSSLRPRHP